MLTFRPRYQRQKGAKKSARIARHSFSVINASISIFAAFRAFSSIKARRLFPPSPISVVWQMIGSGGVLDGHAQHTAAFRIHGGFPTAAPVHLARTFITLPTGRGAASFTSRSTPARSCHRPDGVRRASIDAPSSTSRAASLAQLTDLMLFAGVDEVESSL